MSSSLELKPKIKDSSFDESMSNFLESAKSKIQQLEEAELWIRNIESENLRLSKLLKAEKSATKDLTRDLKQQQQLITKAADSLEDMRVTFELQTRQSKIEVQNANQKSNKTSEVNELLSNRVIELELEVRKLQAELSIQITRVSELQLANQILEERVAKLEIENHSLVFLNSNLKNLEQDLNTSIVDLRVNNFELSKQVEDHRSAISHAEVKKLELLDENARLSIEMSVLETRAEQLKSEIAYKDEKAKFDFDKIEKLELSHSEAQESLRRELESKNNELYELNQKLCGALIEQNKLREVFEFTECQLKSKINQQANEISVSCQVIQNLSVAVIKTYDANEISDMVAQSLNELAIISQNQFNNQQLSTQTSSAVTSICDKLAELNVVFQGMPELLDSKLNSYIATIQKLATKNVELLEQKDNSLAEQNDTICLQFKRIDELKDLCSTLRTEHIKAKTESKMKDQQIIDLKEQLSRYTQRIEKLESAEINRIEDVKQSIKSLSKIESSSERMQYIESNVNQIMTKLCDINLVDSKVNRIEIGLSNLEQRSHELAGQVRTVIAKPTHQPKPKDEANIVVESWISRLNSKSAEEEA